VPHGRNYDFLGLYTGGAMALHGNWHDLYTRNGELACERLYVPERKELWPFLRPPVYALFMAPLALLPFKTAFWVWIGLQSAVLLGCWAWAWKRFGSEAVLWAAMLISGPVGIANGQDCALFLAVLIGAFALAERGKLFRSGLVLGLLMVRFYVFLLWPVVLLVQRRWRMLFGLAACCLAQALLSVGLIGWSGVRRFLDFGLHMDSYYPSREFININAILLNLGIASPPILWLLLIITAGLVVWAARLAAPMWMTFALATAGSLLISPHVYYYDGTLLLRPAWCVMFLSGMPIARLAAATICTPLTALAVLLGPPLCSLTALLLLVFTIALCLEIRPAFGAVSRAECETQL
jgi:alpha-1,2-mannosyltransferase